MMEGELPYEVMLIKRKELPNYTPVNPAFLLPIRYWQRLPLTVTRALGPLLVRFVRCVQCLKVISGWLNGRTPLSKHRGDYSVRSCSPTTPKWVLLR
jgi:hypothetical protein